MKQMLIGTADGETHRFDPEPPSGYTVPMHQIMYPEQIYEWDQRMGSKVLWARLDGGEPFWRRPADMDHRIESMLRDRVLNVRLARVREAIPDLQVRCALWRTAKDKATWVPPTSINVAYKAGEEVGEFMRAVLGVEEHREDRGDPFQEAAQAVLVLLTWFGIHHPDRDLLTEVLDEMERAGA